MVYAVEPTLATCETGIRSCRYSTMAPIDAEMYSLQSDTAGISDRYRSKSMQIMWMPANTYNTRPWIGTVSGVSTRITVLVQIGVSTQRNLLTIRCPLLPVMPWPARRPMKSFPAFTTKIDSCRMLLREKDEQDQRMRIDSGRKRSRSRAHKRTRSGSHERSHSRSHDICVPKRRQTSKWDYESSSRSSGYNEDRVVIGRWNKSDLRQKLIQKRAAGGASNWSSGYWSRGRVSRSRHADSSHSLMRTIHLSRGRLIQISITRIHYFSVSAWRCLISGKLYRNEC